MIPSHPKFGAVILLIYYVFDFCKLISQISLWAKYQIQ